MMFKSTILALTLTLGVHADFYMGSLSGDNLNSGGKSWDTYCNYVAWADGGELCTAGNYNPDDGSGGCPGQNFKAPNWCGMGLSGLGCPSGYQLDTSNDCGATMNKKGGAAPDVGTFYANVIDTDNDNAVTGRCVYEFEGTTDCSDVIDNLEGETIVHCYMDTGC